MHRTVVLGQREEPVLLLSRWRVRLLSEVAEQLRAVINRAVAVSVEREPRVVRAFGSPRQPLLRAVAVEVERYARRRIGEVKAVTGNVHQNGRREVAAAPAVEVAARPVTGLPRPVTVAAAIVSNCAGSSAV